MTWISALNGWQWAVLLAVPPLVFLLYFLKLRRQPQIVASTYLWKRALEDMQVNSLWQRLRRNLLLWLQLLFLLALIFACLRPGISGLQPAGQRWIFLIDQSASMAASAGGASRLDAAKQQVQDQLNSLAGRDVAMVIAFSDRADIRQGFTTDRRRLQQSVVSIEATARTTDIREALRAAAGLANPGRASFGGMNDIQVAEALPAKVFVFSDGGFPPLTEFDLGNLDIEYRPVGSGDVDNVAIEALAALRDDEEPEKVMIYGRLSNYSANDLEVGVALTVDGAFSDAKRVPIQAGQEAGLEFELTAALDAAALFKLEIERPDQLALDNVAYAALRPRRSTQVLLVTPGNKAIETALSTAAIQAMADVQIVSDTVLDATGDQAFDYSPFDLVIFDQRPPQQLPDTNTLCIGCKPPGEGWQAGEPSGPVQLIDLDRTHPMMEFLEIGSIRIVEGFSIAGGEGSRVLIRSDIGPVLSVAPRGPYQDAALGFALVRETAEKNEVNTDWTIKRSFPIFVFAAVEYLGGGSTQTAAPSVLPGQPMGLNVSKRMERFEIELPDGTTSQLDRSPGGQLVWTDTDQLGSYQVRSPAGASLETFAVNLFAPSECRLEVAQDIQLGEEKIAASAVARPGRREFWRWMLLAGFGLLVAEWFIYNRRVFI